MEVIGYGEDGLTYLFMTRHLSVVLKALGEEVPPDPSEGYIVFFRPSLGRAGGEASPQIGEFDAILGTPKAVYFIESKWSKVKGKQGHSIKLAQNQVTRHKVFREIREAWQDLKPTSWEDFQTKTQRRQFADRPLAEANDLLAQNMGFLLRRLHTFGDTQDVLLFFYPSDETLKATITLTGSQGEELGFKCVAIPYDTIDGSGFFHLEEPIKNVLGGDAQP